MKKIHLFLVLFLAFTTMVQAQDYPTTEWSDSAETGWYDENQDEFTLSSAEELAGVAQLVESGTTFEDKTITIDADIDLDGNLWTPIGVDIDIPFSGTFDGNDHTISNLWINVPEGDFQGLFGRCSGASLMDVVINTAHIFTSDTSGTLVGSFGGNSSMVNCHVTNVSITGNADAENGFAGTNIGGLVGELTTDSSIANSYSSGEVTGVSQVGGLAGTAFDKTEITQSYAEGTVSGGYLIGGLVGYCTFAFTPDRNNVVDNCYSRASAEAEMGRAGGIYGGSDGNLRIRNSYATGMVSAPEFTGGVIGAWGGGEDIVIENTYFDTETSGLSDAVGGFTGPTVEYDIEGKPTADMKTQAFVDLLNAGSDESPWAIDANANDGYPVFESSLSVPKNNLDADAVVVYPTAFDNRVNLSSKMDLTAYQMYSYSGALVSEGSLEGVRTLNFGKLSAGMYILKVTTANGSVTKKLIKK